MSRVIILGQRIKDNIPMQLTSKALESEQSIGREMTLERAIDYAPQRID